MNARYLIYDIEKDLNTYFETKKDAQIYAKKLANIIKQLAPNSKYNFKLIKIN